MMSQWSQGIRRVFCCGSGVDALAASTDEPIYENIEQLHQTHGTLDALQLMVDAVDEIRQLLIPIADVPERMRRLEQNLHPLLVYRPEEGEYMDMRDYGRDYRNGTRPAPAAEAPEPPSRNVWLQWLEERINYGEPW